MAYKHGVYVAEQGTSIVAPVTATAGLQVVIGTAPINRASDPYHCTNTPCWQIRWQAQLPQWVTTMIMRSTPSARAWAQVSRSSACRR